MKPILVSIVFRHSFAANSMEAPSHIDSENEWVLKIMDKSDELFLRLGVRTVTMDLLAKELGISKKTIYQHFDSKSTLVKTCVDRDLKKSREYIIAQIAESNDAVDEIVNVSAYFVEQFRHLQSSIVYELEKYFSDSWQLIVEHKMGFSLGIITTNLERGMKEGLYRKDINKDMVAKLYISETDMMFNHQIFPYPQYKLSEIYLEVVKYHIHAIATPEGLEKFKSYKKKLML